MALLLQSDASRTFAVDIHPAAVIGQGLMIDHATGGMTRGGCLLDRPFQSAWHLPDCAAPGFSCDWRNGQDWERLHLATWRDLGR
eukprot:7884512-Ditylum_brightwellii.AAC.1